MRLTKYAGVPKALALLCRHSASFATLVPLALLGGCATLGLGGGDAEEITPETQKKSDDRIASLEKRIAALEAKNVASHKDFTQFQHELQSTRQQIFSVRKSLAGEIRHRRSGLTIDVDENAAGRIQEAEKKRDHGKMDLPVESGADTDSLAEASLPDTDSPARLTDDAENTMRLAHYGEAAVMLSEVQTKYPQFDDGGRSLLLLANGWLKLGEPQNALPPLRQLYVRFPTTFRLPDAKLTEARVQEKLGVRQRALALYREIIASHPETNQGQEARAALARLRDEP